MSEVTPVHGASTDRYPAARGAAPPEPAAVGWSKHRVEALTDGIFAVAMTLLVIDLELPDHSAIHTEAELLDALLNLLPKALSWVMSFFVLRLHPELCPAAMPEGAYHAARLRIGGLIVIGAVALVIARWVTPYYATMAYMLMLPIGRYSRRIERLRDARDAEQHPTRSDAPLRPSNPS